MNKYILIILAISSACFASAQSAVKKNDIYIEAGGNGLFGAVNYERQLTGKPGLGARIGVGLYSEKAFYLTIPAGINYLFKLKRANSFIDAGMGVTWSRIHGKLFNDSKNVNNDNGSHFTSFVPSIGYRRHTAGDVMWRISLTPVANKYGLVPWLGVSIGKRF